MGIITISPSATQSSSALSDQDLLGVHQRFFLDREMGIKSTADTLRIAVIRVEFVEDQVETTTGNGLFDLSSESDYSIDPPPHNKNYFEHQLLALRNYFKTASNHHLELFFDVYPEEENSSYSLPHDMVYYSGEEDVEKQKLRWAELMQDALQAADDQIDYGQYDIYMIFHAGVGNDFAFDFDATPYDIQSAFIDYETLQETLGNGSSGFAGIETAERAIREAIILPETQNQEGYDIGLLGSMTLLMASQLGMPSLFDTETGRAGIGQWGLMDQGSNNFQGLIPSQPCAWTKLFMGWQQPIEISIGENIPVGAPQSSGHQIYKIPITQTEYYLVENRQKDFNGDGYAFGRDANGNRAEFDTTGQVLLEENTGVLVRIDEYDFGIPGSGVLVWHIDETVIEQNLAQNTINNNREHRGVDLVECDGAQDIGYYYDLFDPGYGAETGDYFDPYWSGNESHKIVNDTAVVEFSSSSIPASKTSDGAFTHIKLFDFSRRDSVMTFSLQSELRVNGFPQAIGKGRRVGSLLAIPRPEGALIAAASSCGEVMIWQRDGEKLIENGRTVSYTNTMKETNVYPWAVAFEVADSVHLPLAATESCKQLVLAGNSGVVWILNLADENQDGYADIHSQIDLQKKPTAGPLVLPAFGNAQGSLIVIAAEDGTLFSLALNPENQYEIKNQNQIDQRRITALAYGGSDQNAIIAASETANLYALDTDLNITWQHKLAASSGDFQPLVADFDGNRGYEIFVVSNSGEMFALSSAGEPEIGSQAGHNRDRHSAPALADIDRDGLPEILYHSHYGLVALNWTGSSATNYPYSYFLEPDSLGFFHSSPLWSGGQNGQLVTITPSGRLYSLDQTGRMTSGFPLPGGMDGDASPAMIDLDEDGDVEVLNISADGFIYAWNLSIENTPASSWYQVGRDAFRRFFVPGDQQPVIEQDNLMPAKTVFCYPNPTYEAVTYIRYTLSQTTERVSIRIYDLSGEFVQDLQANGITPGVHEVPWTVERLQSGVYLARVEAFTAQESAFKIIKIAVIK
ncbi:T9SS type A sorting domain-containing protein [candidate division KSB1 bacterium]|nr:T9SS type A sorting domain-containing protein [candidate division KSB1 bacterium]